MDKEQTVQVTYKVLGKDLTKEEAVALHRELGEVLGLDKPKVIFGATFPPPWTGPLIGGHEDERTHDGRGPG